LPPASCLQPPAFLPLASSGWDRQPRRLRRGLSPAYPDGYQRSSWTLPDVLVRRRSRPTWMRTAPEMVYWRSRGARRKEGVTVWRASRLRWWMWPPGLLERLRGGTSVMWKEASRACPSHRSSWATATGATTSCGRLGRLHPHRDANRRPGRRRRNELAVLEGTMKDPRMPRRASRRLALNGWGLPCSGAARRAVRQPTAAGRGWGWQASWLCGRTEPHPPANPTGATTTMWCARPLAHARAAA